MTKKRFSVEQVTSALQQVAAGVYLTQDEARQQGYHAAYGRECR